MACTQQVDAQHHEHREREARDDFEDDHTAFGREGTAREKPRGAAIALEVPALVVEPERIFGDGGVGRSSPDRELSLEVPYAHDLLLTLLHEDEGGDSRGDDEDDGDLTHRVPHARVDEGDVDRVVPLADLVTGLDELGADRSGEARSRRIREDGDDHDGRADGD